MVGPKTDMENRICRAAIEWERAHAEEPTTEVCSRSQDADKELQAEVHRYTVYLVQEALPVDTEEEKVEPSA